MGGIVAATLAVGKAIATSKAYAAIKAAIDVVAVVLAGKSVYDYYKAKSVRPPPVNQSVTIRSGRAPALLVYGESIAAGVEAYVNSRRQSAGNDIFDLHVVIIHAFREEDKGGVDSIQAYYINGVKVGYPVGVNNFVNRHELGTAKAPNNSDPLNAMQLEWQRPGGVDHSNLDDYFREVLGTKTLTTFGKDLVFSAWRFERREASQHVYAAGPPDIIAQVRGCKIYDPTQDSTNSVPNAGNQRFTAPSTWRWDDNPALHVADYLTQYVGLTFNQIDWPSIRQAVTDCNTPVSIGTGTETESRWKCNITLSLADSHADNLQKILSTCGGRLTRIAGKYRLDVFKPLTVGTNLEVFKPEDIIGEVQYNTNAATRSRYNKVRGVYRSPDDVYEFVEFPEVSDTALRARDGQELVSEVQFDGVTSVTQAQRLATYLLADQGRDETITINVGWRGAKLAVGDFVWLEYPLLFGVTGNNNTQKLFRVESISLNASASPVQLTMREFDSTAFTDPAGGDYTGYRLGTPTITRLDPLPPYDFRAEPAGEGGVLFSWRRWFETDEAVLRISDTPNFSDNRLFSWGLVDNFYVPVPERKAIYGWVTTLRNGRESARNPNSDISTTFALPVDIFAASALFRSQPSLFAERLRYRGEFATGTRYRYNDVVSVTNATLLTTDLYRCINGYTSSASFTADTFDTVTEAMLHWTHLTPQIKQNLVFTQGGDPIGQNPSPEVTRLTAYLSFGMQTTQLDDRPYLYSIDLADEPAYANDIRSVRWFTSLKDSEVIEFDRSYSSGDSDARRTLIKWPGGTAPVNPVMIFCLIERNDGSYNVSVGLVSVFDTTP